jgi:predicted amidophosphoribosyltransferase
MPKQVQNWEELEAAAASVGATMDDVLDAATGLPFRKPEKTPTCPACKAKFQHSDQMAACKACGLPDEARDQGQRAVQAYQKRAGLAVSRGARVSRRRHRHGRARGGVRR